MANWLVPVDGDDEISLKPVAWLIAHRDDWKTLPTIHLLNVQNGGASIEPRNLEEV